MAANIETAQCRCRRDCSRTFRHEHGSALPGGPFPGTAAEPGDVRRCEHGRIWCYRETNWGLTAASGIDVWEQLAWWWEPIRYARAVRALRFAPPSPSPERSTQP